MHRLRFEHLFHVPRMTCERCVAALAGAVRALDETARVQADLTARTLRVVSNHPESGLLRGLRGAGFPAEPALQPLG